MNLVVKLLLVYLVVSPDLLLAAKKGGSSNYYDILGVSPKASQAEIKKAFRRLSQKYHPDISKEKDATEQFSKINVAYEALSDPEKRRIYDSSGEEGLRQNLANQNQGAGGDPFGDIFSQFFGGGGRQAQRRDNKGPELFLKIRLTLEDIYNGKEINVWHTKQTICHHCRGSGADNPDDVRPCPECNGTGQVIKRQQVMPGFYSQFQGTCERCHGKGKTFKTKCRVCKASKVVDGVDDFTIFVEKGIPDKHILKFPGQGNEYPDKSGSDINFQIIEMPHSRFVRKGKNLHMKLTLNLEEALLGFDREIVHLDGHVVKLEKSKITQPGDIDKIKGEGMPIFENSSEFGDLFVEYRVEFPSHFSPEQMNLWRDFFKDK